MTTDVLQLTQRARETPEAHALATPDLEIPWSVVCDTVLRMAARIAVSDLGADRRVAVFARNRPSTVVAHAASLLGSAAVVPANFHLTANELAYQLAEADARLVFVDATTEAVAMEAVRDLAGVEIVHLAAVGLSDPRTDAWIGDMPPLAPDPDAEVRPSLLFTSGTTGRPKATELPPRTFGDARNVAGFMAHVSRHSMVGPGAHLVVGPLYHNGPLTAVRLLLAGVPVVLEEHFDAASTLDLIARHKVASSVMVPTHFARLLALPDDVRARADLSSLRYVAHTGGACPLDVKRAMLAWWGPVLYESYGGTESGTTCSIGPEEWLAHPGSVGRAVAPFEVLVVDDDGRPVPVGTDGRLYFRDTTGRGIRYENDAAKTASAHLAPGVFTLGEIGHVDAEGYVYITDRFSDMVVSGGVNIYPAEIEQVMLAHPDVADVACFGVPDSEMGEQLHAAVQFRAGVEPDVEHLRAWCRSSMAGYKCPKVIHAVDGVERNAMGKVQKRDLRDRLVGGAR